MSTLGDIVAGLKEVVLLNDKVERLGDGATKLADGFEAQRQMLVELRHQLQETTRELERTLARMEALEARLADAERDRQAFSGRSVQAHHVLGGRAKSVFIFCWDRAENIQEMRVVDMTREVSTG